MRPISAPAAEVLLVGEIGTGEGVSGAGRRVARLVRVILVCFTATPLVGLLAAEVFDAFFR